MNRKPSLASILDELCDTRIFLFGLAFATLCIAWILPPLQSPDEMDHLKRAWALGKGEILLSKNPSGGSSGFFVDSGLLAYMDIHARIRFRPDLKFQPAEFEKAKQMQWSRQEVFSEAPGTGYYFPIIYLPQAVGLRLGRAVGLGIHGSYWVARVLAWSVALAALLIASLVHPTGLLTLFLLAMPMMLFQFSSASIDQLLVAFTILYLGLCSRLMGRRTYMISGRILASDVEVMILTLLVIFLACAHQNLSPLVLFIFLLAWRRRSWAIFQLGVTASITILGWAFLAMATTRDLRIPRPLTGADIASYYLENPGVAVELVWRTISNPAQWNYWWTGFVGLMGWLDTRLPESFYPVAALAVCVAVLLSIVRLDSSVSRLESLIAVLAAFCVLAITFAAMIFSWTPIPHHEVRGIQGRYFIFPALLLAHALRDRPRSGELRGRMAAFFLLSWLLMSALFTLQAVQVRHYN